MIVFRTSKGSHLRPVLSETMGGFVVGVEGQSHAHAPNHLVDLEGRFRQEIPVFISAWGRSGSKELFERPCVELVGRKLQLSLHKQHTAV